MKSRLRGTLLMRRLKDEKMKDANPRDSSARRKLRGRTARHDTTQRVALSGAPHKARAALASDV